MLALAEIYLKSPAKVNLFFQVLRKRDDGFHEIASLYHAVNLFDSISIKINFEDLLSCDDSSIPLGKKNLIWKAVSLFRDQLNIKDTYFIHLQKKIPIQAGLGGGSSNAATTLWGLNEMYGRPLSLEKLIELGALIGSDVSFFLSLGCAYCTGKGEILERIKPLKRAPFYILKPDFGMSTPRVYGAINIASLEKRDPLEALKVFIKGGNPSYNDLEIAAFKVDKQQKNLCTYLNQIFDKAVMTGSGSSVMCWGEQTETPSFRHTLHLVELISRDENNWY